MSWNLKGSYVETCSCELMCPCNLSLDHGATYDFCRVTLVFDIREGEIDGTDIGGLTVALIADTPKVMTRGTGVSACSSTIARRTGRPRTGSGVLVDSSAGRWQRSLRWWERCWASSVRRSKCATTVCGTASASETRSTSRSRTSCPSALRPASRCGSNGMFHPVGSDLTMAEAKRSQINVLRDRVRGQDVVLSKSEFSWAA